MRIDKRFIRAGLAAFLSATLLISCGGGSNSSNITQVISFGDSLSDVGTYAPSKVMTTGVKWTTNPALLWTEIVANAYGQQLSPNQFARFNALDPDYSLNLLQSKTGTSYAQGSARVSAMPISSVYLASYMAHLSNPNQPIDTSANAPSAMPLQNTGDANPGTNFGSAYAPVTVAPATGTDLIVGYSFNPQTGAPFAAKSGVPTALTAVSIKDQITNYLNTHEGKFGANQMVLIQGGANDLFVALASLQAHSSMAPDPNTCGGAYAGYNPANPVDPTKDNIVTCAAKEMALLLKRLVDAGATHILYANLPDVGNTPEFKKLVQLDPTNGPATKASVTALSAAYNLVVNASLSALGIADKIVVFDTFAFLTSTIANPPAGVVTDQPDCLGPASSSSYTGVTALGCASTANGGSGLSGPANSYIFADGVHPAELGHKLWGDAAASAALSAFPR